MNTYKETPGAKMIYLIRRKPDTSREELVMHWFANHMPFVIDGQKEAAKSGRRHATKYTALLFDADREGNYPWDGMAQLWWNAPLPIPDVAFGTEPTDMFQVNAEPYLPWATREYVVIDGQEQLTTTPNRMNAEYPCTRSGFFRVSFLVKAFAQVDYASFFDHWLRVHVPNVKRTMEEVGGFRYVVSHSIDPEQEQYAGLAELYFHDASAWDGYQDTIESDGMEEWVDGTGMLVLRGQTEMVGIP
jgi:hypothetical protein|tara:strand:+ start:21359 stop:22093 length:735 start_codon:yes stop_codon:yes gene_type:complete